MSPLQRVEVRGNLSRIYRAIMTIGDTSLGQVMTVLLNNSVGLGDAEIRDRLFRVREMLILGEEVPADDRRFVMGLGWVHRHLLPPHLQVYAAVGSGCGED